MSDTIYVYCQRRVYSCGYQILTAFRFDFIVRRMPYRVFYSKINIYISPEVSLFPLQIHRKQTKWCTAFVSVWRCGRSGGRRLHTTPAGSVPPACYCPLGVLLVCYFSSALP